MYSVEDVFTLLTQLCIHLFCMAIDLKLDAVCVTQNPAYGQHPQPLAHEYETPSVNVSLTPHPAKPHSRPSQPDTYYETMGVFEESSEYVVMESTQVSQCTVDGPIYEELTYL